jgi:hypothetical protein
MKKVIRRHRHAIEAAANLYIQFRGEEPTYIESVPYHVAPVLLLIGECDGLLYTTRREGHIEHYQHKFSKRSRPLLASSHDGKQLYLLGGSYNFTDAGIIG